MNAARKQVLKTWIAAILWLILIAIESTDMLSAANTSRILYPLFHFLTGVDPIRFVVWDYYIRKVGHVVGYFGLSCLLFRAWRATLPMPKMPAWSVEWARISFIMTALVACLDEWHQTYLASRTGLLSDVALDSLAALGGQIVIFLWFWQQAGQSEPETLDRPV
ncbi:MAG: VanZ family protein [Acidobacteriia bacterium]|nr:VanZ family protein [Terriglobia bacterium]